MPWRWPCRPPSGCHAQARPGLQQVDDEQHQEGHEQHDRADRGRPGIVELLKPDDDQERRDLGHVGQVAGDEDHRAVLADRPGEGHGDAGEHRGRQRRQDDAQERLQARRAERRRRLLDVEVEVLDHRLDGPDDEGQADEGEGDDHPHGRERHLEPERDQELAEPAVRRVDRREGDAGDGRREREGQVDDGVEHALQREVVAHQHPGDQGAHDQVDERRRKRRAEAQAQGRERPGVDGNAPELLEPEAGAAQEHRRQRQEYDEAQIGDGEAERQPEARDNARLPEPSGTLEDGRPCLVAGPVDLVEHAAVAEVGGLRLLPAAEAVDAEELDLGEARHVLGGGQLGLARTIEVLGGQRLALGRVEELEVGLGRLARALRVDVGVDDRDGRLGQDALARDDDLELVLAELLEHEEGLVLPGEEDIANAALGKGGGRTARTGVEHRNVAVEVAQEGLGPGLVAAELVERPAIGREIVPARAARGLRVRRDHLDVRLDEIAPILHALGVALADNEHDRRGVGRAAVGQARLPIGRQLSCLGGDLVDVRGERQGDDVGVEAVDHGARLLARAAVRHLDRERSPVSRSHFSAKAALNSW